MSTEGREQELLDWVAGDLPAARKAEVDAHLRACAECRALVRDLQTLSAGLELLGDDQPVGERSVARASRARVAWTRIAAAAAIAILVATPFGITRLRRPIESGPVASARVTPAAQLGEVSAGLAAGDDALLARHARTAPSVPVRLAALSGAPQTPAALPSDELVAAFAAEDDTVVRLWLIVAIARTGSAAAAAEARAVVDGEGAAAAAEVRAAVDAYLRPADMRGAS